MPQQSYIEEINTFPLNTEVKMVTTWMAPSGRTPSASMTGKLTFRLNVSFVQLPDKPMQRRLFDPRVGYFTDGFTLYSDDQQRVANKRFITRWRLEPKNEEDAERMKRGELVEPKKQIVYYIDPATPKQWRKYLIAGVEDWQEAFEQAGFKNAIVAKEWPDSDKTMSMEDARYSVIRYLASDIPNAYGPQVHDPRTGEILESHICWYHNVMKLVHDWYMVQAVRWACATTSVRRAPYQWKNCATRHGWKSMDTHRASWTMRVSTMWRSLKTVSNVWVSSRASATTISGLSSGDIHPCGMLLMTRATIENSKNSFRKISVKIADSGLAMEK